MPTEVCIVKTMVFPVVMYGCESWTIKKAEHQRIDAFELWCWRRLLRVPWTARRSNQSILKEISPGCPLEGLMLKLKLQILWPPDAKNWLIGKDPDAGTGWRQEEKRMAEDEMVGWYHWLDGHEFEPALGVGDGQGSLECCSPWCPKESNTSEWVNNNKMVQCRLVLISHKSLDWPHVLLLQLLPWCGDIVTTVSESWCFILICTKQYVMKIKYFVMFILNKHSKS